MPTPAGCLARGSVPGREEAQRERTFGCPVGAHASLAFSWARHAWHGGVEAGRSEPWPSGELRGPRGSSVAPGGAQGELSRPRQSDLRGSTVTPGGARSLCLVWVPGPGGLRNGSLFFLLQTLPCLSNNSHDLSYPSIISFSSIFVRFQCRNL